MSEGKTNVKFGFWGWFVLFIAIGMMTGGKDGLFSNILIGLFLVAFIFRKRMYRAMEKSNRPSDLEKLMKQNPVIKRKPSEEESP